MSLNRLSSRPCVALALPYWEFWESSVPYDLRAQKQALLREISELLQPTFDVLVQHVIASREDARSFAEAAAIADAGAILILQTMAVPPAYVTAATELLPDVPLIVWAHVASTPPRSTYDHSAIADEGGTVGVPMLTNLLVRRSRPFHLIVGSHDEPDDVSQVQSALKAAYAAFRIRRARIGVIGRPPDGYDCVEADVHRLHAETGVSVVNIHPAEVRAAYHSITAKQLGQIAEETEQAFKIDGGIRGEPLERSLRLACAVEEIVRHHELDAGVMNCHVPEIRFASDLGVTPCFGLGRMTSLGVPWTCAGDTLTVIAMLCLKLLGGAALFHELEAVDRTTGEFIIANTGEHDLAFGGDARPSLSSNPWFEKDPHCGICAQMSAVPGAATLVAFTELDNRFPAFRLIVAQGVFTTRCWPGLRIPSGSFRFARGKPRDAWVRWCEAGANHHSAASGGDYRSSLQLLAKLCGFEFVPI